MERPTTTHNDPLRPTTTPLRPTTTHNDPQRPHYDPLRPTTTTQQPTTTHYDPQRSQNYLQLQFCMTILVNNITYCLWIHHVFYYCKGFDPNPDLHANRWDLKLRRINELARVKCESIERKLSIEGVELARK